MGFLASKSASSFELAPAGACVARCYRVIDLGTQETEFQGQKKLARKIMLTWELLGDEQMEDGRPFSVSKRYTLSLHEKAQLRKDLESWRGRAFTPAEEAGFDVSKLAGAYCLMNVVHEMGKNGSEYANVASIMTLPKNMPKPTGINDIVVFNLDDPDMTVFNGFGEKLKATIQAAREWGVKPAPAAATPPAAPRPAAASRPAAAPVPSIPPGGGLESDDMDDDVPF